MEMRERFSALFEHLAKEEETLKNVMSQNEIVERQLRDLRHSCRPVPLRFHGFDEAAELRQEALLAEQRCALQSGEAGALAAAAATYERQCARLQERCQAEASQERAATESLGRSASEIQQLKAECRELSSRLEASELQRQRILREQQEVQEASKQTAVKSKEVQEQLGEQRFKSQKMQDEVVRGRHELAVLEKLVVSKQTELQHSKRWLAEERETALEGETRLREMVGKKTRYEEELNALSIQLEECRKEGCDLQSSFDETCREARMLQERLRAEEQRHRSELESAEASRAQKERLEAELKGAEGAKADAETELGDLRKLAAELAEHCSSQRRWRDEQLQKQASNELASERLRKEIQQLQAEQERLQEDAKLTMNKRNRLEVELQVAKPALDDARRRCKDLEGRLVLRVRELSDESERVRRLQQEADMAKARLVATESQNIGGRKLLDASPKTFGDFRCGELQARNSPRSPPALQSPPALLEPRLGDIRRLQDGYSGYPHSPPSQILQAPQPLKEPRGDMSGARLSKSSPMGTLGNTTPSTPLPAPNTMDTDTVRFLCEYVAKEEARLGLSAPK